MIVVADGARVMFTGDSITDCHRRETDNPLGYGYPLLVAGQFGLSYPERAPVWLNSGISGDTLAGLGGRWGTDVLDARPDVVSILIGINDCGYRFSFGHAEVTADEFRAGYRRLLGGPQGQEVCQPRSGSHARGRPPGRGFRHYLLSLGP